MGDGEEDEKDVDERTDLSAADVKEPAANVIPFARHRRGTSRPAPPASPPPPPPKLA